MRILQICPHYVPAYHYGGVLQVAHSLSRALTDQGHEVFVCTTNLKDPSHNMEVRAGAPVDVDGAQVYYDTVPALRYWGLSPAMARRVWNELEHADVVLIHFHYQFASLVGSWASRLRKKPYIIFSHGSLNHYGVTSRSKARKQIYLKLLEQGNFRKTLFTAYHSEEEMENSMRFGRCQVVPNGIDPKSFAELPPPGYFRQRHSELKDKLLYLFLARIDAGKGLDILLPAFRRLSDRRQNAHLVLAGGDERGYEAAVRRMVADLGLADRVTLTGLISGPDKLGALQDADAYVLPSRSEGLSIAMLEAMYMRLPVVVTDRVGLWRKIQERKCGMVVPPDEARLAEALCQIADDPERVEMGRRGHRLVAAEYTWDSIARELIARIKDFTA